MMKIATPAVTETKSSTTHITTHPLPDVSVGDDNNNIIMKWHKTASKYKKSSLWKYTILPSKSGQMSQKTKNNPCQYLTVIAFKSKIL